MARILFLLLLIVEIGAAIGWVGIVLGWAARQSRTDATVPLPPHVVGLPLLAGLAVLAHLIADPSTPGTLWWIPLAWVGLSLVMLQVRRIQCHPRRRGMHS